mmetsp:Transcript_56160/g.64099  ORF Transcript_56160/g.64099 Transcript_56160/m.64099 type:complete len:230 (-) Transcript_56160:8-697(-)
MKMSHPRRNIFWLIVSLYSAVNGQTGSQSNSKLTEPEENSSSDKDGKFSGLAFLILFGVIALGLIVALWTYAKVKQRRLKEKRKTSDDEKIHISPPEALDLEFQKQLREDHQCHAGLNEFEESQLVGSETADTRDDASSMKSERDAQEVRRVFHKKNLSRDGTTTSDVRIDHVQLQGIGISEITRLKRAGSSTIESKLMDSGRVFSPVSTIDITGLTRDSENTVIKSSR